MDRDALRGLWSDLAHAGVNYVTVGGIALNFQGLVRATEDVDLFVLPEADNVARLRAALHARFDDPSIADIRAEDLAGDYPVMRYVPPGGAVPNDPTPNDCGRRSTSVGKARMRGTQRVRTRLCGRTRADGRRANRRVSVLFRSRSARGARAGDVRAHAGAAAGADGGRRGLMRVAGAYGSGDVPLPDGCDPLERLEPFVVGHEAGAERACRGHDHPVCGTRRKLNTRLSEELSRAERYGSTFSVLLLDLDHFKTINDTYGHHVGDAMLREVAHLLQVACREPAVAGRWGSEEFMMNFPQIDILKAEDVASRIRERVESEDAFGMGDLTISIGVPSFEAGDTHDSLFGRFDRALQVAKERGRYRVEVAPAVGR